MFFFQAILHVGAPYIKKMRHFCDIGLHHLLDYNDLTRGKYSTFNAISISSVQKRGFFHVTAQALF